MRRLAPSQSGVIINNNSGTLGLGGSAGDFGVRSEGEWTNDSLVHIGVVIRP